MDIPIKKVAGQNNCICCGYKSSEVDGSGGFTHIPRSAPYIKVTIFLCQKCIESTLGKGELGFKLLEDRINFAMRVGSGDAQ